MNEEVFRINELKGISVTGKTKINRISAHDLVDLQYQLNTNMTKLYQYGEKLKINDYINAFVENMFIILNMASDMRLTPDYFFNVAFKSNAEFLAFSKKHPELLHGEAISEFGKKYSIYRVHDDIIDAVYNGEYKDEYKSDDFNEKRSNVDYYFMKIVDLYKKNNEPYGRTNQLQCQKSFLVHYHEMVNIMLDFYNCDDVADEIECMMNLLYEYLCFFVEIGVDPKIYLDECIEEKMANRKK